MAGAIMREYSANFDILGYLIDRGNPKAGWRIASSAMRLRSTTAASEAIVRVNPKNADFGVDLPSR